MEVNLYRPTTETKTSVPINLHNVVGGLINIFLPERRQIKLDVRTETITKMRKMTYREISERVIKFFDEPGVVR